MSFDEEFLDQLVAELAAARLEAIIIGNVAGILQGAPVLTQDVDLLVRDTPLNRKKLRAFASAMGGVGPDEISGLSRVQRILGTAVPIDILFDHMGKHLTFRSVRSRSVKIQCGAHTATVASLADIIRSKEAAGRPKDRAALPLLL